MYAEIAARSCAWLSSKAPISTCYRLGLTLVITVIIAGVSHAVKLEKHFLLHSVSGANELAA